LVEFSQIISKKSKFFCSNFNILIQALFFHVLKVVIIISFYWYLSLETLELTPMKNLTLITWSSL